MWEDIIKRKLSSDMALLIDNIMVDGKKRTRPQIHELLLRAVDDRRKHDIGYKGQFIPNASQLIYYLKTNYLKERNYKKEFLFWK